MPKQFICLEFVQSSLAGCENRLHTNIYKTRVVTFPVRQLCPQPHHAAPCPPSQVSIPPVTTKFSLKSPSPPSVVAQSPFCHQVPPPVSARSPPLL